MRAIGIHVSWSALLAAAALGLWALGLARSASLGYFPSGPGTSLPDLERWTLPVLAACAVLAALALPLAARRVRYRRALPGVSPAVDAALRTVSLRRCLLGAQTANLVLTGALLTAVPLLSTTADPAIAQAAGVIGTVVVGAAMVRLAAGLLRWAPRRSPAPLQHAQG